MLRHILIQYDIETNVKNCFTNLTIKNAVTFLSWSVGKISCTTIKKCWNKTGLVSHQEVVKNDDELTLLEEIKENINILEFASPISIEDYINLEKIYCQDTLIELFPEENNIIIQDENHTYNYDKSSDEDDSIFDISNTVKITFDEAFEGLKNFKTYVEQENNSTENNTEFSKFMKHAFSYLYHMKKLKLKQKKITQYFETIN